MNSADPLPLGHVHPTSLIILLSDHFLVSDPLGYQTDDGRRPKLRQGIHRQRPSRWCLIFPSRLANPETRIEEGETGTEGTRRRNPRTRTALRVPRS